MDSLKPGHELRVRNVSLHRRGKPEHGTLYLTRHHLIFSYQPGSAAPSKRVSSKQELSSLSGESNQSEKAQAEHGSENTQEQPQQQKVRSKEVYVPYPLINRCVLRPSTAQSGFRTSANVEHADQSHVLSTEEEELFPPTIGTNTYSSRTSMDSAQGHAYAPPKRVASPMVTDGTIASTRPPAIRIRCKDFSVMAFHFHTGSSDKSADDQARQVFYSLRDRCCVHSMDEMYAFHFQPPAEEVSTGGQRYDTPAEFGRMGIGASSSADDGGRMWRITDINAGYEYSITYPQVLAVPRAVSDNILKYCGSFRSKARIPALAYLHPNGGSITRSSQPLVGVQNKRNPQDEKLVSAIFWSHTRKPSPGETPPNELNTVSSQTAATIHSTSPPDVDVDGGHEFMNEDLTKPRIYGSTRRNLIVDARPKINMIANKAAGGGIEDIANYTSPGNDVPVEKVHLNIANIHSMRSSLEKVVDALGSADYIDLAPNQEALRKSGWLGHIAGILDGAEMVARVVGLGASHALIHCSDGWDRTSQISALAQVMLDPHYRTLKGFITLIQKDFLSFGHKFRHRQGTEGSEKWFEIENERVQPGRAYQPGGSVADANQLHVLGSRALSGARNWFDKNRSNLFGQPQQAQNSSPESLSRPRTPPANPVLHSSPSPAVKEEKHKMDEKEVAPIFHQFLDAVYQLMYQEPTSFEFNERFLRRLFYHSYSGQYGEFLYNSEKERSQKANKLPSVWAYFLARRADFTNPQYATPADGGLLFPRRHGYDREVEVRWWASLYGRKDEEMNVPRSQSTMDMPSLAAQVSSVSLDDANLLPDPGENMATASGASPSIRPAKSTPALHSTQEAIDKSPHNISSTMPPVVLLDGPAEGQPSTDIHTGSSNGGRKTRISAFDRVQTNLTHQPEDDHALPSTPTRSSKKRAEDHEALSATDAVDKHKVASPVLSGGRGGGLDFAMFAQQNAFSER